MALLPLIIAPDPLLKQRSEPVEKIDDGIKKLVADMFDTMYHERGIGLAAVQVGQLKRIFIADVNWREEEGVPGEQRVFINPEILKTGSDNNVYKEGCLSFPDQFADVERPKSVKVRYQNLSGEWIEEALTGLLATCFQHELDHVNGIVFVDHLSLVKRDTIIRKLKKLKKLGKFEHEHVHVHGEHCNH